jgi:hypothetical protein
MAMNLLAHRVVDILFEEGGRFALAEEAGGRARIERLLEDTMRARGVALETLSIHQLRIFFHEGFEELLERAVPADTRDRVGERFRKLVFQ